MHKKLRNPFESAARSAVRYVDAKTRLGLAEKFYAIKNRTNTLRLLNALRRAVNPILIKLQIRIRRPIHPLKLHLGCGDRHLSGFVNIDFRKTDATDAVLNILRLPYPDNSAAAIETYHVIEHLPRHGLPHALKEWHRVLMPKGTLIIECPDFDELVRMYLSGDSEKALDGIFAHQRFEGDYHLFGYNFERLKRLLEKSGFIKVTEAVPQDYHARDWPCIRVECNKAGMDEIQPGTCDGTFSGERVVEGSTPERIWRDHISRYNFAKRYVRHKTVLDIACGTGYGSRILRDADASTVVGMDIAIEAINHARSMYSGEGLEFRVGDILEIDSPSDYFDIVTSFETIEHVQDQSKALRQIKRVLKPGGLLIISSPNRKLTSPGKSATDPPNNPFHVKEYLKEEFISELNNYFHVTGVYGQRAVSKFIFLPLVEQVLRRFSPSHYDNPERGLSEMERATVRKEYRYITAVCRKVVESL